MKHIKILLTVSFSSAIVVFVIFYKFQQNNEPSKMSYLKHLSKAYQSILPEGPDKALLRDLVMTMNPETGEVRNQNTRQFFRSINHFRTQSDRNNFNWEQINTEIAGRVRSIMIDPNDSNKLWAGAVSGGLWYTPNFRQNEPWIPISDDWECLSISCIAYDPNDPQTFYVGTGESYTSVNIYRESSSSGVGIYKSSDAGNTWSLLSSTDGFYYVNDIVLRDENGITVIYAAVASGTYQGNTFASKSDGIFRSEDGGSVWSQVLPNIEGSTVPFAVSDIELTAQGTLYAGTMRNLELKGGGRILSSTNGLDWMIEQDGYADSMASLSSIVSTVFPGRVELSAATNGTIYALATSGKKNIFLQIKDSPSLTKLLKKEENSDSWEYLDLPQTRWSNIPWHALSLKADPIENNRLLVGALDFYLRSSEPLGGWGQLSNWRAHYTFSDYFFTDEDEAYKDSLKNHFVHADIHSLVFASNNSSNELLISSDGGVGFSSNFSVAYNLMIGESGVISGDYPTFRHINNSFASTQYYTVAISPIRGSREVLGGTQDNGTYFNEDTIIGYKNTIAGADGAYCFFDSDDQQLKIVSIYANNWIFYIGKEVFYKYLWTGTFINPAEYDDRSNLLYINMATDGGYEAFISSIEGRYLDTIGIININHYLNKDTLGLNDLTLIKANTGSTSAFSAFKISPHTDMLNATLIVGNQLGEIYQISDLPYNPNAVRIDSEEMPVGYVSSVDIGSSNDEILVTYSNYGVPSIWYTSDGGSSWKNIDRNLPDIPVRQGLFNPHNFQSVLLATEVGVWEINNLTDSTQQWVCYNQGFPNVRVDAIDIRASDTTIVAATHGRGLFFGKFMQQEEVPTDSTLTDSTISSLYKPIINQYFYPNPTKGIIHFNFEVRYANIFSMTGKKLITTTIKDNVLNLSELKKGIYMIQAIDDKGIKKVFKAIKQ